MKRSPVKSSNIVSAGHDPARSILEVEFTGGKVYHYDNVPAKAYAELIGAKSVGQHFRQHIQPRYRCTKGECPEA